MTDLGDTLVSSSANSIAYGLSRQTAALGGIVPALGGSVPGGYSQADALQAHRTSIAIDYAWKNLFLIEISSRQSRFERFNLFVTGIDYSPISLSGEKRIIGSSTSVGLQSSDPIELRVSTMDDAAGTVKSWFAQQAGLAAHVDGTVGLPAEFAIDIVIVHAVVKAGSLSYQDVGLFRCASMDTSQARSERALQEVQMTFQQLDPFMPR